MIEGKRVLLRGLEVDDAEEIIKHWNDLEVRQYIQRYTPLSLQEEEEWIRKTWENRRNNIQYVYGIVNKARNQLIGTTSLNFPSYRHRRTGLGIVIWNKEFWNKGYGTEALLLMLKFGFKTLGLNQIVLSVVEFNHRARHVYEKVGFQEIGQLRDHIYFGGHYHALIFMDILASEFHG